MPELPEVQTVVDTLRPKLVGRTFGALVHLRRDIVEPANFDLTKALRGRTIRSLTRRAKRIVFTLDDGETFYIHLGMSGRLTVQSPLAPIEKHTHLIARLLPDGSELRFRDARRFGGIFFLSDKQASALGPEPLGLRTTALAKRLRKTHRPIKNALMDQRFIAGLGNIYVDESLHRAGIHPRRIADQLRQEEVARLSRAIKNTLRRAIRHRGSTLRDYVDGDGAAGAYQSQHCVYGREGERCRTCKSTIRRIVMCGRSTHFCPKCQPHRRA